MSDGCQTWLKRHSTRAMRSMHLRPPQSTDSTDQLIKLQPLPAGPREISSFYSFIAM